MMIRGQVSPMFRRAVSQWGQNPAPGMIQNFRALDVLPPELRPHLDALSKAPPPDSLQGVIDHTKYGFFTNVPLNIGLVSTRVLQQPSTTRIFLFIVNTHATQFLFVRFGGDSNALIGVPIQPLFGFIGFDTVVPQDDIYLIGNGGNTTGVLVYSNKDK